MNLQLKGNKQFLPSGHAFVDPRTGKSFCAYELGVSGAIAKIIDHRQRNPRHYPTSEPHWFEPKSVLQELLGPVAPKRPDLFVGLDGVPPTPKAAAYVDPTSKYACVCGSTEYEVEYCKTCSGRRVIGFKCLKCGTVRHS